MKISFAGRDAGAPIGAPTDAPIGERGVIFNIQRYAVHDGPGIRTTVFLQGCPLRCWWCHNPESQRAVTATGVDESPMPMMALRHLTARELGRELEKDVVFFDESGGGVTFSGGEPLMQPEFLLAALQDCAAREIHTALDTCGHASPDVFRAALAHVDLVLYDLKLLDDTLHRQYTGVSNRQILENLRLLSASSVPYCIRFPVIPGITDTPKNLEAVMACVRGMQGARRIHLLPYHGIAAQKYERLGRPYRMEAVETPNPEALQRIQQLFEAENCDVIRGG